MKKVLVVIVLIGVVLLGINGVNRIKKESESDKKDTSTEKEVKKLQIFDEDSKSRNIAVMINNNHDAWPHAGLNDSFLNYEIIAEGGITRIMAIFKDKNPEKIGSVRSSRPYYLDYVLENDAIYVHWGGSEQAYSDINSLNIDHIDGMNYEGTYFYRDTTISNAYEHTGFTKMSMIKDGISNLNIRNTTNTSQVFKYSVDEINLSEMEGAIKADYIDIPYSYYTDTSYTYDEVNKVYLRYMSDEAHIDAITNTQYTAKNIITYKVHNETIYGDTSYRQELDNIGSGEGYYITNGYAVPITWEKSSRSSKTIYRYKDTNEEIKLNDGNTWVQIQPDDEYLDIRSNNLEEVE